MKTQIAWKRRGRPALPPDLADITSLADEKDTAVYSIVRKVCTPGNTLIRSAVDAGSENFQDTEWGWEEYK